MERQSDGFSLVEVILAVAILGIVAMSLLTYFSGAGRYAAFGKNKQKADMAGQSVLEEINTCRTFEQIEQNLVAVSGSAWTLVSSGSEQSLLTKEMTVDDTAYQARVTLDYDYDTPSAASSGGAAVRYNNYETPQLAEVYSSNNVVFAESDQTSTAIQNFYYKNTDVPQTTIRASMTRDICLDISKDTENSDIYRVRAYYEYHYDGAEYETVLKESKIETGDLQNIYFFYEPLRENVMEESVRVNVKSGIEMGDAAKISVYLICQKGTIEPPAGYHLSISGTGNYMQMAVYTNGASTNVSSQNDIVKHMTGKRIAQVTVDIYLEGETDYSDDNRIVRLQTAKGA